MTKSELILKIYTHMKQQGTIGLRPRDTEDAVNLVLDYLAEALQENRRIEIRGFGVFRLHAIAARMGRNPKTGQAVPVPEKSTVHFKPGAELRQAAMQSRNGRGDRR